MEPKRESATVRAEPTTATGAAMDTVKPTAASEAEMDTERRAATTQASIHGI